MKHEVAIGIFFLVLGGLWLGSAIRPQTFSRFLTWPKQPESRPYHGELELGLGLLTGGVANLGDLVGLSSFVTDSLLFAAVAFAIVGAIRKQRDKRRREAGENR